MLRPLIRRHVEMNFGRDRGPVSWTSLGNVIGRPLFMGITIDLSGHDALDRFSAALRSAAWDLGVAGG